MSDCWWSSERSELEDLAKSALLKEAHGLHVYSAICIAAGSTYYILLVEARQGAGRVEREGDEAATKKWMGAGRGKFGVGSATALTSGSCHN
jgi:hypothetical protein